MDRSITPEPLNLLDILECAAASLCSDATPIIGADEITPGGPVIGADEGPDIRQWWGPVIAADDGPADGQTNDFDMTVLDDDSTPSDPRLKQDVECIGKTVLGLNLYRFRYVGSDDVYEGVMADEVLELKPSAVSRGEDGFLRVHYRELGLEMRKVA